MTHPGESTARAPKAELIYISAASHSGSTLLGMLLGSHPELCTVGELKATSLSDVASYRCSCRELLTECEFWRAVESKMADAGHRFRITRAQTDLSAIESAYVQRLLRPLTRGALLEQVRDSALALSPRWRARLPQLHARNAALARVICELTGSRAIVDSSKTGLRLKYLLRNPDINVRVVRLVRDGRAVALTYTDPSNFADASDPSLRGGGTGRHDTHERLALTAAAREWRRSNEEALNIVKGLPADQWIEVRYEDLCANAGPQLQRIFQFIGVAPIDTSQQFRARTQHVIGNGMRLDSTSEIRLDDRWRRALDTGALAQFNAVAGDLNARLGYV